MRPLRTLDYFICCLAIAGIVCFGGCSSDSNPVDPNTLYTIHCWEEGATYQIHSFSISTFWVNNPPYVHWNFGDGTAPTVDMSSVGHMYVKKGTYTVTATCYALDRSTVLATVYKTITISSEGKQLRFLEDTVTVSREEQFTMRAVCYNPINVNKHVYLDWGDGPPVVENALLNDTLRLTYKYDAPGVHRVIARYGGDNVAEYDHLDTAYVHVKEYLRPCNAKKITITISGAKFLFGDTLLPYGGTPSAQTFELTQFEYSVAGNGKPMYEINWNQSQRLNVKTSGFGVVTSYTGFVKLNKDGTMIEDLDFDAFGMRSTSDSSIRVNQHFVLYQVPLSSVVTPAPDHAVYELTGSNISTVKNRFLHREVRQYYTPVKATRFIEILQWLPTPSTRIRVEFSKE